MPPLGQRATPLPVCCRRRLAVQQLEQAVALALPAQAAAGKQQEAQQISQGHNLYQIPGLHRVQQQVGKWHSAGCAAAAFCGGSLLQWDQDDCWCILVMSSCMLSAATLLVDSTM